MLKYQEDFERQWKKRWEIDSVLGKKGRLMNCYEREEMDERNAPFINNLALCFRPLDGFLGLDCRLSIVCIMAVYIFLRSVRHFNLTAMVYKREE
jgi:hypothetical protein